MSTTLQPGESREIQGSGKLPYVVKNVGGIYSCTCPGWRNCGGSVDQKVCKHTKPYMGVEAGEKPVKTGVSSRTVIGAPPVMLAPQKPWDGVHDLTNWLLSVKRDGVRFWWNGEVFVSRAGNAFDAPNWMKSGLPKHPLDGEFYLGRGRFFEVNGITKRKDWGEEANDIKLHLFDRPDLHLPQEKRLRFSDRIGELLAADFRFQPDHVVIEDQVSIDSNTMVLARLEAELALNGEGLIAKDPESFYEPGRSDAMRKIIVKLREEARVTGYTKGKGNRAGKVGALECVLRNGVEFEVGTGLTQALCANPPAIGAIITVEFKTKTPDGKPREPTFQGERTDIAW